jgi:hypothetical protein
VTAVRLPRTTWEQIDLWRREHGAKTRSEAVRVLLQQALATDPGRPVSREFAAKASDLAGQAIDRLADPSATTEEQAKRKRRLIKGPQEFRPERRKV